MSPIGCNVFKMGSINSLWMVANAHDFSYFYPLSPPRSYNGFIKISQADLKPEIHGRIKKQLQRCLGVREQEARSRWLPTGATGAQGKGGCHGFQTPLCCSGCVSGMSPRLCYVWIISKALHSSRLWALAQSWRHMHRAGLNKVCTGALDCTRQGL